MKRTTQEIKRTCPEADIYTSLLLSGLDDANVLDLGCGDGTHSQDIASRCSDCTVLALDVDEIQHGKNLHRVTVAAEAKGNEGEKKILFPSNLTFGLGGAEEIPAPKESFDVVFLFKSLHHVPVANMEKAMEEIYRVLKRGGYAYISEPFRHGDFMEIIRIFHDEERVQTLAFEAMQNAIERGLFKLVEEVFINTPLPRYSDFRDFERMHIDVSYREQPISADVRAKVKESFEKHMTPNGVSFVQPLRIDLLQKI